MGLSIPESWEVVRSTRSDRTQHELVGIARNCDYALQLGTEIVSGVDETPEPALADRSGQKSNASTEKGKASMIRKRSRTPRELSIARNREWAVNDGKRCRFPRNIFT
ncbi:hypothetical protein BU17DRAFT_71187 [Hysterangium stoloniferum]|nr:hypothetical protein BU17DRAFT_71187 [Hysterangium stoloniferum]